MKGAAVNYFCYILHELDICQLYTHKVKLNYKVTLLSHYCQFYCMVEFLYMDHGAWMFTLIYVISISILRRV